MQVCICSADAPLPLARLQVCEYLGLAKHEPTLEGKWKEAEKIRLLNMVRAWGPAEPWLCGAHCRLQRLVRRAP